MRTVLVVLGSLAGSAFADPLSGAASALAASAGSGAGGAVSVGTAAGVAHRVTVRSVTQAVGHGYGLVSTSFLRYSAKLLEKHGSPEGIQFSDMLDRELLGGLIGDIGMVLVTSQLGPMLPVAPAIRETLIVAGGFLGWELGSGHIADTDWLKVVTTEVGVASGLRIGLIAAGMSPAGLPLLLITMEGSVLAGRLVDHVRDKNEAEATGTQRPGSALHPGVQLAVRPGGHGSLDRQGSVTHLGEAAPDPLPSGNGSYLGAQGEAGDRRGAGADPGPGPGSLRPSRGAWGILSLTVRRIREIRFK
jgi:hypothetical protein